MTSPMDKAWQELHEAAPPGWHVGRPSYHPERREWLLYAFDPSEPVAPAASSGLPHRGILPPTSGLGRER